MAEQGFRKWIIVITVITAAVIELIDTSIVNVALTEMSGNLGATIEDAAWVITAYAIANVIIIPMTGFLAALFGRRNYYIGSILLFTVASFLCGHATSLGELVLFRFLQGAGGGALLSTSQAILFEAFTIEERPLAAGIFSLGIVIGPTIGPTLGGWIIDNYSWPWIFHVNVPIGIVAAALAYMYVKEPADRRKPKAIDWFGMGMLAVGVGALQFVLERGEAKDWFATPYIAVLAIVAGVCLIGFIWRQLTYAHPVVDLSVLTRSSTLAISGVLTFVLGFGLFSSVFIVPVFAQRLLGYNAMQTGLLMLPGALTSAICLPIVGRLMQKLDIPPQPMVILGFLLTALYSFMLSKSSLDTSSADFLWPLILRGIGLACISVPLTSIALYGLRGRDMAQAAALNNMMRQLGGSFGIAFMNTYIAHRVALTRAALTTNISIYNTATQERLAGMTAALVAKGSPLVTAQKQALAALDGTVTRQSYMISYLDAFILVAIFFIACVPLILMIRRKVKERDLAGPDHNATDDTDMVAAH